MTTREAVDILTDWINGPYVGLIGIHEVKNPREFVEAIKTLIMEFEYEEYEEKMP